MNNEEKIARFKRVAERRTKTVLRDLRILSNCGNTGNYTYTGNQVRLIFTEIDQAVKKAKSKFNLQQDKEFKL